MYGYKKIRILGIKPDHTRSKLEEIGAKCTIPLRRIQKYIFSNPLDQDALIKIIHDGGKTIATYTSYEEIQTKYRIKLAIDDINNLREIYQRCGLKEKSLQEFYKETRMIDDIIIHIERRPGLQPFLHISYNDQTQLENIIKQFGYTQNDYRNGTIHDIYNHELGIPHHITNTIYALTFNNPPVVYK